MDIDQQSTDVSKAGDMSRRPSEVSGLFKP